MTYESLKFTDLSTFLRVMEQQGYNGEITDLIFEGGKLPYASAYFVPTHLLPADFDLDSIHEFGGCLARVEEIRYLGTERYTQDFMVFPLSLTGYLESGFVSDATFAPEIPNYGLSGEMVYVINLEDGGGKEFFATAEGKLIGLIDPSEAVPQQFKTFKQANKKREQMRDKYPPNCRIYALELREFEERRKTLQRGRDKPEEE